MTMEEQLQERGGRRSRPSTATNHDSDADPQPATRTTGGNNNNNRPYPSPATSTTGPGTLLRPDDTPSLHAAHSASSLLAVPETSYLEGPSIELRQSDSQAEIAVHQHLNEIESSFSAPISPFPTSDRGIDDTYDLFDSAPRQAASAGPKATAAPATPPPPPAHADARLQTDQTTQDSRHGSDNDSEDDTQNSPPSQTEILVPRAEDADETSMQRADYEDEDAGNGEENHSGEDEPNEAHEQQVGDTSMTSNTTSSLEAFSPSPPTAAAAAAGTTSRTVPQPNLGGRADDYDGNESPHEQERQDESEESDYWHETPTKPRSTPGNGKTNLQHTPSTQSIRKTLARQNLTPQRTPEQAPKQTPKQTPRSTPRQPESRNQSQQQQQKDNPQEPQEEKRELPSRPKYLKRGQNGQRGSISSQATDPDPDSDHTIGMGTDYALHSGGASFSTEGPRDTNGLTRTISLGSFASGYEDPDPSGPISGLTPLDEAYNAISPEPAVLRQLRDQEDDGLRTPTARRTPPPLAAPSDTVLARHVRDVQVPESLAKEYRAKTGLTTPLKSLNLADLKSPGKLGASVVTARTGGKSLTLKEQSSTIERLSKENFDLKLKVMFLSDRLDKLSEEGIKEMISENVELKTGLAVLQRDNKMLRKRVKELEKQVKDEDERPGTAPSDQSDEESAAYNQEVQEELMYLREQLEEHIVEIERLRNESLHKEAERRRMAEMVRTLSEKTGERFGGDLDRQEEADVYKDLLEQETARREQSDEDNRRLREELFRLKQEMALQPNGNGQLQQQQQGPGTYLSRRSRDQGSASSRPATSFSAEMDVASSATTLIEELRRESEQLRHENAELRREVGAQTSMLTSRNREKERLYQEIEDLKMAQRRGGPAPSTIDSLLERSASRAGAHERSHSRASGRTGMTGLDDADREELENKLSQMRDKANELKLHNQDLERELAACMEDFEMVCEAKRQIEEEAQGLREELEVTMQDLVALQAERDETLQEHANLEQEFEALRKEAQEEIDALEGESDLRSAEIERLQLDLNDRNENFDALQEEMRKMSDALVRLEDEQEAKHKRIQTLEQELNDANRELEELEFKLLEANDKANRLSVQQESSQGEIAFLREEQENDKIRIGDLEAALANSEQGMRDEKERVRELENRLAQERRQREIVANREKEEVQQFINELNKEATAAKDEARRLRKSLTSREVEATEWKERLLELENNLREALGDLNGTRSSLLKSIAKLQMDLEKAMRDLDTTKASLAEKDRIIKQRDALLESHALESRKVGEMLDKERQAHRNTKNQFETFQKTHQHVTRTLSQSDARIAELEAAKAQDKKRIAQLESTYKEQLTERNTLLLNLWTRLSSLCGSDWAHDNSLINGRALPSLESVATMFPGFSKNLLAAVKTLETMVSSFQTKVKSVERDLWREYQALETHLEMRIKKMDRLENIVRNSIAAGTTGNGVLTAAEAQGRLARLEEAYRQLKVENHTLRTAAEVRARAAQAQSSRGGDRYQQSPSPLPGGPRDRERMPSDRMSIHSLDPRKGGGSSSSRPSSIAVPQRSTSSSRRSMINDMDGHADDGLLPGSSQPPLSRMQSNQSQQSQQQYQQHPQVQSQASYTGPGGGGGGIHHLNDNRGGVAPNQQANTNSGAATPGMHLQQGGSSSSSSDNKWMLRLRDLEYKLKAEREGRILDRNEALKRINTSESENLALRENLEREKRRKRESAQSSTGGGGGNGGRQRLSNHLLYFSYIYKPIPSPKETRPSALLARPRPMLSTVRNNAVRRNFGLGQVPCLSSIVTKAVTYPNNSNHSAPWHARRAYQTTQGLEARKSAAGQMMAEALGIMSGGEQIEVKPKKTRTRKTKKAEKAEENTNDTTEVVEEPKPTTAEAEKVAESNAEDGEKLEEQQQQPVKRGRGRPRKDENMTIDDKRKLAVLEREKLKADQKLVEDIKKKIAKSKRPPKPSRTSERSMLRPVVDDMQERLYDTGVWSWLDYGRSTTKLNLPPHLKKVDKSRVHITSEKLCDDILGYIKPSLMRHEGCDIIDINPGAGVWSTKLNDLLKPRTHLLLEPDAEFYKPMLDPLLQREGTRIVERDGVIWAELLSVLTPDYLPHQKEHRYTATGDAPQRNDTLLVTANLGSYPKKKYSSFSSATAMILYQFNHAIRSGALFQKYGLVRMLLWIDDTDRPAILPHNVQRRRRMAVDAELNCDYIMHIAGPDYSDVEPSKKSWFFRDANIDQNSALATLQRMREAGIVTPPGRETKILREVSQNPSAVVTAGTEAMTYDFRHQAELDRLEAQLEAGVIAIDSADYRLIRRMRTQIQQANKRFNDVHACLAEYIKLMNDWQAAKAAPGGPDEAALAELMTAYKEFEHRLIDLGSTALGDWHTQRDNLHMWDNKTMFWDRRTVEPLVTNIDEFFPHAQLSLIDIQPKAAAPVLRSMGPGSDRSGDMAEILLRNMLTYITSPVSKVLDRLAPGAHENIFPLLTSVTDPDKGGVPFPGLAELTVRAMSANQFEEIMEQWMKWPFKPSLQELVSHLSDEYKDAENEESGKFGGVSPEF
ncbi:hypothetical protein B0T20DRAFT_448433 [Sordaria brevicollis]|uniref:Mitochondrial transcription factor 1 n=1 Tax=Sordaria brevicollis TaxID=83679 RepID=A0AAE0NW11_SORBR|nr:hypothetical protein B0T20DRAFT_448433 [Sordaria brevicollis]